MASCLLYTLLCVPSMSPVDTYPVEGGLKADAFPLQDLLNTCVHLALLLHPQGVVVGPCLTLLCVLHCAAHLLPLPELTETRLLNRTIKVFTKIDPASEKDTSLYTTLKGILTPILHELCDKAAEESEHS
ncbi:hypothetical protein NQZ68_021806 [Dissostichus eleginoides]|nr:hypothetical protein NQZ68_021806 [Dissostichus eleginoides]